MRRFIPLSVILLAACSQESGERRADDYASPDARSFETTRVAPPPVRSVQADRSGPSISPTAAPGVAFNYRYAFRLPAQRIAAVQEQHAAACEKLGVNRCRITGLHYRLVNERDIEAMLAFKLDPAIARHFGKAGVEAVAQADGMLIESAISGEDAGAAIEAANRTEADLGEDLRRIEARLEEQGLSSGERARLRSEAERLRRSIRANRETRDERQESIAVTPMVFHYGSGDLVPGFDTRSPIRNAFEQAGNNFIQGMAALFVVVGTLLPWALLAWLGWIAIRRWLPRFGPAETTARAPAAAQPDSGPDESDQSPDS